MLTRDGIHLFKFYLDIGRQMQLKRFHRRRHDPLRRWKFTDIDLAAIAKRDDYTKAKKDMFHFTHTAASPWTVLRANDTRRTRLEAIRSVLYALDYEGKEAAVIDKPTAKSSARGQTCSMARARRDGARTTVSALKT
jgi:polyphosphate kinase